jgi:hypothetical protein
VHSQFKALIQSSRPTEVYFCRAKAKKIKEKLADLERTV